MTTLLLISLIVACKCSPDRGWPGRTPAEVLESKNRFAEAIFEGTLTRNEFKWPALDTPDGQLIPNDNPRMVMTFHVDLVHKGTLHAEVQLVTGLGGGDCGAEFLTGIRYLVYADRQRDGALHVSRCSPGSRLDSGTGTICGTVTQRGSPDSGTVAFLSSVGYSPFAAPYARLKPDGSYRSPPLGPGQYRLFFLGKDVAFHPGFIEVIAGRVQSASFDVPGHDEVTVRAFITVNAAGVPADGVDVQLVSLDGRTSDGWAGMGTDFPGAFPFGNRRYLKIENVHPGRYAVLAFSREKGWRARKSTIDVGAYGRVIFVELEGVR